MRAPVGAFSLVERMLGDLKLSVGQWTQLRAIDHKYQQSLFTLLDGAAREILEMLTPDQRIQRE